MVVCLVTTHLCNPLITLLLGKLSACNWISSIALSNFVIKLALTLIDQLVFESLDSYIKNQPY